MSFDSVIFISCFLPVLAILYAVLRGKAARNVLLVTVDDLCALRGVPLEAGLILKGWPEEVPEE